jgi:hypothetical protein
MLQWQSVTAAASIEQCVVSGRCNGDMVTWWYGNQRGHWDAIALASNEGKILAPSHLKMAWCYSLLRCQTC